MTYQILLILAYQHFIWILLSNFRSNQIIMKNRVFIILLALLVFNCNTNEDEMSSTPINFTHIGKGGLIGVENIPQQNAVIFNQADWESLKNQIDAINSYTESFDITQIDFSKFMIIASFDEVKFAGGSEIEISNIVEMPENISVNITHSYTQNNNVTTVLSQAFHIVKLPINTKPVVFE
jgi:hypothetical protein